MSDTLFHLETELVRLMAERRDLIAALDESTLVDAQVALGNTIESLELQIRDQVKACVRKVDGFRGYLLHANVMAAAARAEKNRQAANEKAWADTVEHLKTVALAVLNEIGESRLEGKTGAIRKQVNGGKVPVVVSVPALVPDEFCTFELTVGPEAYQALAKLLPSWIGRQDVLIERKPHLGRVELALKTPCSDCAGTGLGGSDVCRFCNGSGSRGVPGAHLGERGEHIRIT